MSASNTVTMVGNLVDIPTLRFTKAEKPVANARVAVNDRINVNGQWRDQTTFLNIVVWGQQAENFVSSVEKGTRIMFTGRVDVREYVPEGGNPATDRTFFTEVNVSEVGLALKFAQGGVIPTNRAATVPAGIDEPAAA